MQKLATLPTGRGPFERASISSRQVKLGKKRSGQTTTVNTFCSKRKQTLHSNSKISLSVMINMVELTHVHEILKTLLYKQKIPKCALAETFPSFETTDKRSRAFGFSRRLPDSYSNGTSTGEGFKSANVKSGTTKTSRSGREAMRKKDSILKVCHSKGDFLSSLFLISQKDVKNKPVVNLRDLN